MRRSLCSLLCHNLAILALVPEFTLAQFATPFPEKHVVLPARSSFYEGTQPFDMLKYRLDISLAMVNSNLQGKCSMIMLLKENVDSLVLHAVGLSLDTVRVDGIRKSVTMNSSEEQFTIHLNDTRFTGDTLHVDIHYTRIPGYPRPSSRHGYYFFSDTLPGLPANLGYTFSEPSDARFWFPCYDEPWEKATAEINITVPAGYVAASNGKLQGTVDNGNGTMTWQWREDHQIATYLMCITASRFTVSTIPYVKVNGDTIPLQYFSWATDSAGNAAFLPTIAQMMSCYENLFGAYPFDKYAMSSIVPFVYLGMEHQTMTTLNRYYQRDQRVCSHELAHQWWGDDVTCGTWADIWLNEGFATYSEALWRESTGGATALRNYMRDTLSGFQYASWQGAIYDPLGQGFNLFDQVVYSKAAWVLHMLRGIVGDMFFPTLRAYRERYAGKSAITNEFKAVVDSMFGYDMTFFFDQWIFGPGWPKYAVDHSWTPDTLTCTIYQLQSTSWPTYKMPVRIDIHGQSPLTILVVDTARVQSFKVAMSSPPDSVTFDPEGWILKQMVTPPGMVAEGQTPSRFALEQNYPNPFNPSSTIRFSLPSTGTFLQSRPVILKVFDLLGREVATLVNAIRPPGEYSVVFDGSGLASGFYTYRLSYGGMQLTRKMMLMR